PRCISTARESAAKYRPCADLDVRTAVRKAGRGLGPFCRGRLPSNFLGLLRRGHMPIGRDHVFSCWRHKRGAIMNIIRIVSLASLGLAVLVDPALAFLVEPANASVAVPGPIAGVGLPALVLIGGAYWVGRKFFGRKE